MIFCLLVRKKIELHHYSSTANHFVDEFLAFVFNNSYTRNNGVEFTVETMSFMVCDRIFLSGLPRR